MGATAPTFLCFHEVHEYLRSKLCSLYNDDCIFDNSKCYWNGSDRPAEAMQGARPPRRICPSQGTRAQDFPGLKPMKPELTGTDGQARVGKAVYTGHRKQ